MLRRLTDSVHRTLRHYGKEIIGTAETHKDKPILWSGGYALRRAADALPLSSRLRGAACPSFLVKPLFLVCSMRSGSSLAAACLDEHPGIDYVGFELGRQWVIAGGIEMTGTGRQRDARCPPLEATDATVSHREHLPREFARLHAKRKPGTRFLNKNPHLWNKLPFLHAIFPDAGLIVASRDVRSTAASIKLLWERNYHRRGVRHYIPEQSGQCFELVTATTLQRAPPDRIFPGGSLSVLADFWLRIYETIERECHRFSTVVPLRARDLIADPTGTLNTVYAALELDPATAPFTRPLDPTRNDRWRMLLTTAERDDLESFVDRHRHRIEKLRYADSTL